MIPDELPTINNEVLEEVRLNLAPYNLLLIRP